MNGFINKYRWVIVIVAGGLAAWLAYYSQQDEAPVEIAAEKTDTAVINNEAEETKNAVTEVADKVVPEAEAVAEETTQEEVVVVEPAAEAEPVAEVPTEPAESAKEEAPTVEAVAEESAEEITEEAEKPNTEAVVEPAEEPAPVEATISDEPEPEQPATETAEPTNEAVAVIEELASTITATGNEESTQEAIKPSFDVVRVDPTGSAVIAGSAEPYSKVIILSNNEEIGEAIAGDTGEFVAIIQIPENEQGQTLELETEVDGQLLFSDETILILPVMRSTAADTVTEESAPPIIRATAEDVVILQGAPVLALGQVSLDSISYDENDEVVLAGRGNPGRTIIIYVDGAALIDTVVSDSGSWKQALTGLDAGRYVLRVDEVDEDGTVTSRVESPFQREYSEDVREAKTSNETTYTVQPGNSLWIIATGRYGEGLRYHQIFSANKDQIRDPDLIYPGQVFAIPESE